MTRLHLSLDTKALALVGSVTIMLFTSIISQHYLQEKAAAEKELLTRAQLQSDLLAAGIAQAMWDFNTRYIHSAAQSALQNPDIIGVTISDSKNEPIEKLVERQAVPLLPGHSATATSTVQYVQAGKEQNLGRVELTFTREILENQLEDYLTELIANASLFFVMQLLLLRGILRYVMRPVQAITHVMRSLARGETSLPIPSQARQDEIGEMARAIQIFKNTAVRADELAREVERRRALQAELEEAKEAAETSNMAKSQFLANMSHEIRTPMNGIIGITEMLLETNLNKEQRKYAGIVMSSADNLLEIINDVLDFSKIEAGKLSLEEVEYDIREATQDIFSLLSPKTAEKNISLKLQCSHDVPENLIGDHGRIRQILINLIGNAVKFTEKGEVNVSISVQSLAQDSVMLHVAVQDSGIGIAQDKQRHIFEKFTQEDYSHSRKFGGSGLGLAICKQLTEMMGGSIGVNSQVGRGSLFWFTITQKIGQTTPRAAPVIENHQDHFPGTRILVAEDNPVNSLVITRMLEKMGCSVIAVANGREAVEMVERLPFHLVFMDCQMPEMDGFEATKAIHALIAEKKMPSLPIVALTAHVMGHEKQRCFDAGMDDFLVKPTSKYAIAGMLGKWLAAKARESA